MTLLDRLLALANIRANEGKVFAWALLYAVLANTMYIFASTAAYALFLSRFDAARLPYIYIISSVLTTLISVLYLQLSTRYSLAQLLVGQFGLILLSLIGYRVGLTSLTDNWFIFSLLIWDTVVNTLLFTALWNLLGRLFNLQQGKRLFGLIGAGQQLATLVVGLLVPVFVAWGGTPNLFVAAAVVGAITLGVLRYMTHTFTELQASEEEETEISESPTATSQNSSSESLLADPYVRLIFLMYILFAFGTYFIDNIFYIQVEGQLTTQDQLASFLGIFSSIVGGFSLLNQLFLGNRLLSRYGVRAILILTPALLFVGVALFSLIGTFSQLTFVLFITIAAINLIRQVMDTLDNTAANLLYQPLLASVRTRAQTTVDGMIAPIAGGVSGLLLLGLTNVLHFDGLQLSYVLLPILAIWALSATSLGRLYPKRVQQALRQRIIQGNSDFQPDRASLEILQQSLTSPHPGIVIYALNVLEESQHATSATYLPGLLTHPNQAVRLDALARLEKLGGSAALPAIEHCFHSDNDNTVRSAALRTMAALGGLDRFEEVYSYLDTPDPQLRQGVMVGLLRSGELEGILAAGEMLAQLVNSTAVTDRVFAAQVLGESGIASFYRPLLKLLSDPEAMVRRAALTAAGQLQHAKLWPVVIENLASPKTRSAAQKSLADGGEATLADIKTAFAQAGQDKQLWIELTRACGRVRSPQAVALLLPQLDFPDIEVRTQTLLALCQCHYQASAAERPRLEEQIQAEFAQTAWMLATLQDLGEDSRLDLLRAALETGLVQQRKRLLLWLTLLYEPATILRARDALGLLPNSGRQPSEEQRAYALETLDGLVAQAYKQNLLVLFDDLPPVQMLARLGADFPQPRLSLPQRLHAIITSAEAWVDGWSKAVALYSVAQLASTPDESWASVHDAATAALSASAPIVRETAAWTLNRLNATQPMRGLDHIIAPTKMLGSEGDKMLLTIEKVMILKTVDIFATTPDEILVDIAALLKEISTPDGALIFEKGERGDSMYLIVEGEVEARDGDQVFARMGERQVFGEMALLDGEPRTASIYTTRTTRLLRLDQEPFYELMDDRIEVARGIIHVLLQRLRLRTIELNNVQTRLTRLAGSEPQERATN